MADTRSSSQLTPRETALESWLPRCQRFELSCMDIRGVRSRISGGHLTHSGRTAADEFWVGRELGERAVEPVFGS